MGERITSDRAVAALKPAAKPYERPAGNVRGLIVRVFPDTRNGAKGAKTFELRYVAKNGVRRRLPLGPYPSVPLAEAVKRAEEWRGEISKGRDPAAELAEERAKARTGETLAELADAYFKAAEKGLHRAKGAPKREKTLESEKTRFKLHIKPKLGECRFVELKRGDLKSFMNGLAADGSLSGDTVSSIGRTLSAILAFAVHEERLEANPIAGLTSPLALKPRERFFDEDALAGLWRALSAPIVIAEGRKDPSRRGPKAAEGRASADPAVSLALRFIILTLSRRAEAAGARWREIDVKAKTWTIPPERHKTKKVHVVPLSAAALEILAQAKALSAGRPDDFLFPSPADLAKHVREDALTKAIARTCDRLKLPHGSPHDFRRAGATTLTGERLNVRRFIVSKVLGHSAQEGAVVTGVYDRNDYLAEKRVALEKWAQHVLAIASDTSATNNLLDCDAAA